MKSEIAAPSKSRWGLAVGLMLLSALMFSAMQLMIRFSSAGGSFPLMEQVFFRNLIGLPAVCGILLKKRIFPLGSASAQPYLFGRSLAGFLGIVTFFYATNHARIADANILNKLSPIFVTLLSALLLRERIPKIQCAALALSFFGAWLVCGPGLRSAPTAMLAALLSALFSGIAYTFVSALRGKADSLVVITHFSVFSVLCALPGMAAHFTMPTAEQFFQLMLISVFGSLGQIALTYSYHLAPAPAISVYNYSGIVWSALLGWLFLGEALPGNTLLGGLLIIAASLLTFIHTQRNQTQESVSYTNPREVL